MVIVPSRAMPGFGAALNDTLPLPAPDEGPSIVSQALFEVALHAHDAAVVTAIAPDPPAAPMVCAAGAIENVHAASWATANACPPIVRLPLRAAPPLTATE